MAGPDLITDALLRARDMLHRALADLTPQELAQPPNPPIGWLAWHLVRVQDSQISALAGREQAWLGQGWHARFGMAPEPRDFGPAHTHTHEMIAAFRGPDARTLLDYHDAVFERSIAYLAGLSAEEMGRALNEPRYDPLPTVGTRLVSVVSDNLQHAGQIEYLRGLLRSGGWFPAPRAT